MAIDQRMLAEYLRRQQQQGMSLGRPPITMESQVNALANQPVAPGMVGAYVDQSKPDPRAKSFTGAENRIKSQRAMANMLRGKEAPKGKTVGPYDLYMGPNWGESLAYAGEQALGGYMAGKANRDDIALDEEKGRVLAATLAAEDEEKARKAALEQATLDLSLGKFVYDKERDRVADKVEKENRDYIGWINPNNPNERGIIRQGDDIPDGAMLATDYTDEVGAENTGTGRGKPAAKAVSDYTKSLSLSKSIFGLNDMYSQFDEGQREMLNSPNVDIGLGIVDNILPEGVQRKMEEGYYSDKPVLEYRIKASKLEANISKLMAGLTVTGFEMKDRKKWSPMAEGITQGQRQSRLNEINNILTSDQRMFETLYPAYSLRKSPSDPDEELINKYLSKG